MADLEEQLKKAQAQRFRCQTEAEADFDMIIRLANAVDESDVPAIVVTEVSDQKLAETILGPSVSCQVPRAEQHVRLFL